MPFLPSAAATWCRPLWIGVLLVLCAPGGGWAGSGIPVVARPLTEVERKDLEAEARQTAVVLFGFSGEFFGFSRTGRGTAHWTFPWVAGLSERIDPPSLGDLDASSPSAWASDGHGLLILAFPHQRDEGTSRYRLLALGLPSLRLLAWVDLEGTFAEAPKLRFDESRLVIEVEAESENGDPFRRAFTQNLQPAAVKASDVRTPTKLRQALTASAFEELKQVGDASHLADALAESWLETNVVDASADMVILLVPGESESRVVRLVPGTAGAPLVRAPRTLRSHIAIESGGLRMLVEELELRPHPELGRPDNFATGRLVLLDLEAGKVAATLEDPRLSGFLGGPLCMGWNGEAVVAADRGLFLVRWQPKPEIIQLLHESKRNDWRGCVFTSR